MPPARAIIRIGRPVARLTSIEAALATLLTSRPVAATQSELWPLHGSSKQEGDSHEFQNAAGPPVPRGGGRQAGRDRGQAEEAGRGRRAPGVRVQPAVRDQAG